MNFLKFFPIFVALMLAASQPLSAQCGNCGCELELAYTVNYTNANCNGSTGNTVTVTATAPAGWQMPTMLVYGWSAMGYPGATVITSATTYTWHNLPANVSIRLWVASTDPVNGCSSDGYCTLVYGGLGASTWSLDPNCNETTGYVGVNAYGGTEPYTYAWSNGSTDEYFSALPGNYNVTITDANGCTATGTATVNDAPASPAASVMVTNSTCGEANGIATVQTNASKYKWSNGATTQTITGLMAGTYTVTVTNTDGCTASATGVITNVDMPTDTTFNVYACSSYTLPNGQVVTGSSTNILTTIGANGCTHTEVWNVTIGQGGVQYNYISGCGAVMLPTGYVTLHDTLLVQTVTTSLGCVDTIKTFAQVFEPTTVTTTVKACAPIFLNNTWVANDTTMTMVTPGNPCDVTQNLVVDFSAPITIPKSWDACVSDTIQFVSVQYDPISGCISELNPTTIIPIIQGPTVKDTIVTCDYSEVEGEHWTFGLDCKPDTMTLILHAPKAQLVEKTVTTCNPNLVGSHLVQTNTCDADTLVTMTLQPLPPVITSVPTCDPDSSGLWWNENVFTLEGCPFMQINVAMYTPVKYETKLDTTCDLLLSGVFTETFQNVLGCDSLIRTTTVVYEPVQDEQLADENVCYGEFITWMGQPVQIFETQQLEGVVTTSDGCEKQIRQLVKVNLPVSVNVTKDTCDINLNNQTFSSTLTGSNGCDSTTNILYRWVPVFDQNVTIKTCIATLGGQVQTDTVPGFGDCYGLITTVWVFEPNLVDSVYWSCDGPTGKVVSIITDSTGCVTKTTVYRYNYPKAESTQSMQVCPSEFPFNWNGLTISGAGDYEVVLPGVSSHGCDSIVNLSVYVLPTPTYVDSVFVCEGEDYAYQDTFLAPGTHTFTFPAQTGCDTTFTIVVTTYTNQLSGFVPDSLVLNAPKGMDLSSVDEWVTGLAEGDWFASVQNGAWHMVREDLFFVSANDSIAEYLQAWALQGPCGKVEFSRPIYVQLYREPKVEQCEILITHPNLGDWVYITVTPKDSKKFSNIRYTIYNTAGGVEFSGPVSVGVQENVLVASLEKGQMYFLGLEATVDGNEQVLHDVIGGELVPVVKKIVRQ